MRIDFTSKWAKIVGIIVMILILGFIFKVVGLAFKFVFSVPGIIIIGGYFGYKYYKKHKRVTVHQGQTNFNQGYREQNNSQDDVVDVDYEDK